MTTRDESLRGGDRTIGILGARTLTPVTPLPEPIIEQLAELWCEALWWNVRRHPLPTTERAS
jgi:hypothetical protein